MQGNSPAAGPAPAEAGRTDLYEFYTVVLHTGHSVGLCGLTAVPVLSVPGHDAVPASADDAAQFAMQKRAVHDGMGLS